MCLGKATKLCDIIGDWDKTYEAVLLLGRETDTEDTSGQTLKEREVAVTEEEIRDIILSFQEVTIRFHRCIPLKGKRKETLRTCKTGNRY